ncbi:MAG: caspase family protein [Lewinellaceae bacterium]|nr:caspase family protein [Lewinellaceae bacterium]
MKKGFPALFALLFSLTLSAQKPELIFPLDNPKGYVSLDFSANGKYALSASLSGLRLWDVASGKMLRAVQVDEFVIKANLSPDGRHVGVEVNYNWPLMGYWDGRSSRVFAMDDKNLSGFSATGRFWYYKSVERELKAWDRDIDSIRVMLKTFDAAEMYPSPVNDFNMLTVETGVGADQESSRIRWLDLKTGKKIAFPDIRGTVRGVYWMKNNAEVLVHLQGSQNGNPVHTLQLLNFKTAKWGKTVATFTTENMGIAASGAGDRFFIFFEQDKQFFLDLNKQPMLQALKTPLNLAADNPDEDPVPPLWQFTPDGTLLALVRRSEEKTEVWDVLKHERLWALDFGISTFSYAGTAKAQFSPDGRSVLIGEQTGQLQLKDSRTGTLVRSFSQGEIRQISSLNFDSDYQLQLLAPDSSAWQFDLATAGFGRATSAAFSHKKKVYERSEMARQMNKSGSKTIRSKDGNWIASWRVYDAENLIDGSGLAIENLKTGQKQFIPRISEFSWTSAAAFSPDNTLVMVGKVDNVIQLARTSDGQVVQTLRGHTTDLLDMAITPDNKFAASVANDQVEIKFWDLQKGTELAALYFFGPQDWAIISPSGLFDATPGMMQQMYYVYEREIIELEQLKERYYEPGLLQKLIGLNKDEIRDVTTLKSLALYPTVDVAIQNDQLAVKLSKRSGGMGKLSFFINGKEVVEDINPTRLPQLSIDLKKYVQYYLPGQANNIALRAYNSDGWLKSAAIEMPYQAEFALKKGTGSDSETPTLGPGKPHLFAIAIGTSNYSGDKLDLNFPDLDATAMAQALGSAGKALFEDRMQVYTLTSSGENGATTASKTAIRAAFADVAKKAKSGDVLVAYFSGHGLSYGTAETGQFYYLTKDIGSEDLSDPEIRNKYTISSSELTEWLTAIPAQKQVMILDACNSGKVVESLAAIGQKDLNSSQIRALDRMKDRTGMFILTGSAADKVSYEASKYGQGLLTYSLLQGMSGLALTPDKRVDVMTLFQYARDEVPNMAKDIGGIQTPVLAFPANGGSFDIGIVNEQVHIPLAQVKPIFIRNNFQDEAAFADVLGLTDVLEKYFREITVKGAQADLIYVDVKEYEGAYSIKGRYTVDGNAVQLRGRLFKGLSPQGEEFQISGKKDNLPALAEAIIASVSALLNQ